MNEHTTRTIHKFRLPFGRDPEVNLPEGHRILMVGWQRDCICVWIELDTTKDRHPVWFSIHPTGTNSLYADDTWVGSCQTPDKYVWHVYKRNIK